jgi:hypothetical protein
VPQRPSPPLDVQRSNGLSGTIRHIDAFTDARDACPDRPISSPNPLNTRFRQDRKHAQPANGTRDPINYVPAENSVAVTGHAIADMVQICVRRREAQACAAYAPVLAKAGYDRRNFCPPPRVRLTNASASRGSPRTGSITGHRTEHSRAIEACIDCIAEESLPRDSKETRAPWLRPSPANPRQRPMTPKLAIAIPATSASRLVNST